MRNAEPLPHPQLRWRKVKGDARQQAATVDLRVKHGPHSFCPWGTGARDVRALHPSCRYPSRASEGLTLSDFPSLLNIPFLYRSRPSGFQQEAKRDPWSGAGLGRCMPPPLVKSKVRHRPGLSKLKPEAGPRSASRFLQRRATVDARPPAPGGSGRA